jgi:hypothetical protein
LVNFFTKILFIALYTNLRYIVLFLLFFCFYGNSGYAQVDENKKEKNLNSKIDSLKVVDGRSLNIGELDTIANDTLNKPKEYLEDNIIHNAKDYMSNDFVNQRATLYNEAELFYQDIEIRAGEIIIDYKKNLAYARGIIDTAGEYIQRPQFKQGNQDSEQDSLIYNFKNEKAIIYNSKTEQQGMIILGELTKKENDSTFFINKARFTTSDKDDPDYYISTSNIKVVPNSKIVGGFSNLVVQDVPTPLILPFFYAPITRGRASGIILPTFGESRDQGYFLQNGGYYFSVNEYIDLAVVGDVYTNGSWGLRLETNYALRYRFSGGFSFRYESIINGQRGLPDYSKAKNFFIIWNHSQAAQSNPNARFSASVNFGNSQFFRESLNESSSPLYLVNTFSSSISYFKKFVNTPFSMNASLTHTQNTNTDRIDMNLPSFNLNMDRVYPFAPKVGSKKNVFQKIGVTYSMAAQNRISNASDEFFGSDMFKNARSGIKHDVALGTSFKLLKYFTVSPNATYKDVWYFKSIEKRWDPDESEVVTDTINGFKTFREYQTNVSLSTTFYGTYNFNKGKLQAIRHVVRPSVSYGYRPDFSTYFDAYQISPDPDDFGEYNPFQGGVYGGPSSGLNNNIGISLNNTLEAKVRSDDPDSQEDYKKVNILNNLNFSTSYNIASDSLGWSPLQMTTGTQLLKNKLNINLRATLDPYAINSNGTRINTFNINNGGSLFRLTGANLTSNYSISSDEIGKNKKQTKSTNRNEPDPGNEDNMFGKNIVNSDTDAKMEEESIETKIYQTVMPWDIRLQYSLTYSNLRAENTISTNSLQLSGNIEFSPKWRVGVSSGYDFRENGITYTQLRFERDLDSWRFSFNWIPFGDRATYYFYIGIKSAMLSDLKYDQRQTPDKRLF